MRATPLRQRLPRLNRDLVAGAALTALGLYIALAAREYPFGTVAEPGPGFVPFALGVLLAACGAVLTVASAFAPPPARPVRFPELPHVLVVLAALCAAAFAIERIGFRLLVVLMLLFFLLGIERRNPLVAVAVAAAVAFGAFYLINDVLRVPLPVGPWGW